MIFKHMLNLKRNKGNFLLVHIACLLIFSVLYFILDNYLDDSFSKNNMKKEDKVEKGTYYYWLWFSVITQTTVGYSIQISDNDEFYRSNTLKYNLFKILNIIQCLSIWFLTALFI